MNIAEWARKEIELLHNNDDDYFYMCCQSAYKALESLLEDEHSGASIVETKHILNRLIDRKPLTAIEDTPDVWEEMESHRDDCKVFHCNRMSSLFKDIYDDGRVEYHDNQKFYCADLNNPIVTWHNGFINKLLHEKYPITMPYFPTSTPYIAYCSEGLYDPKNGDFDTIAIWYVKKPDGEKESFNRFFKESDNEIGWEEITEEEYVERTTKKEHK